MAKVCLKLFSSMGVSSMEMMNGATGMPVRRMMKPAIPPINMIVTSKKSELIAYAPATASTVTQANT